MLREKMMARIIVDFMMIVVIAGRLKFYQIRPFQV